MKKNLKSIIIVLFAVIIVVLVGLLLKSKTNKVDYQTFTTKDSLQTVLDNQVIAQQEAKALAEQQVKSRDNLLQSSGLSNLQLPGIYWEWVADSTSIVEGIKTFKLYNAERDDYPDYRWAIQKLIERTFGGTWEQFNNRSNSLIDLFIRVPNLFKVIYDLNKGIVSSLKTSWGLPNQGEELMKYLGSKKYPYDKDFEQYFQKHVRDSSLVFSGESWQALDSICQLRYPEIFKSEQDTRREYGNWRVVRANFSPEAKGVLLYVLTNYNGGVAAKPAANSGNTTKKSKSISDWFK